jgi:hypothetical protein
MTATICIFGASEIKNMQNSGWEKASSGWTPLIQITDINGNTATAKGLFNFDGVQSVSEKGVRIAIPKTPIDIIIEYHE